MGGPGDVGFLRGGEPGDTYWTIERYETVGEATGRLALLVAPEVRMRFRMLEHADLVREDDPVRPAYGRPGGGTEYMSRGRVMVEVIAVEDLE